MNNTIEVKSRLTVAEARFMIDKLCSLSPDQQDMVDLDEKEFDEIQKIAPDIIEEDDHGGN